MKENRSLVTRNGRLYATMFVRGDCDPMSLSPKAGKPADPSMLVDIPKLISAYYVERPDPGIREQRVAFGTSGHRGSSVNRAFNENHILAVTQAICDYRHEVGIDGPLYIGFDTHALSYPAFISALEVLAANRVETMISDTCGRHPPPPSRWRSSPTIVGAPTALADGIVITPSHNPPQDGGFKYNPPNGGPADTDITKVVEARANEYLAARLNGVKRLVYEQAIRGYTTHQIRLHRRVCRGTAVGSVSGGHPLRRVAPGCGSARRGRR